MSLLPKFPEQAIEHLSTRYGYSYSRVVGNRRHSKLSLVRHVCCWVLRYGYDLSFPEIGRILKKDHTSVIYGVRKVDSAWGGDAMSRAGKLEDLFGDYYAAENERVVIDVREERRVRGVSTLGDGEGEGVGAERVDVQGGSDKVVHSEGVESGSTDAVGEEASKA